MAFAGSGVIVAGSERGCLRGWDAESSAVLFTVDAHYVRNVLCHARPLTSLVLRQSIYSLCVDVMAGRLIIGHTEGTVQRYLLKAVV